MDLSNDAAVQAAVHAVIAEREAGPVLHALYHRAPTATDGDLDPLAGLVPTEQISSLRLVERLALPDLASVILLLATLRALRTNEAWVHYALCKYLTALIGAGVAEAKLPVIIHSLLALEGLKDKPPNAKALPLGVLAREFSTFAPREAIRSGMLAMRYGNPLGLNASTPAFAALGLEGIAGRPLMTQTMRLAKELHFSADTVPRTTNVQNAAGLVSAEIEPVRHIIFPLARGDSNHYIFAQSGREVALPGISVHRLEGGAFSIDAASRGLEQHYVFDSNEHCVNELASGIDPFISDDVVECDEPVAILDDRFSGVMNICHFLLDRVTRLQLYERAWSRPGKFFMIDAFPYYREVIARIGMEDRVIIPEAKRVTVRAPEIVFSSNIAADFRHPAHYCSGWAIDGLRRVMGVEDLPARRGRKVLISRADAKGRGVLNWDELLPVFARCGFETVELTGLPLAEQMALFRDAAQVVGVHGAGLTNILFAPRDCSVLEILPPLVATRAYWLLASRLGQRYTAMIADDPELPRPDYASWQHDAAYNGRSIIVPIERLEAALATL